MDDLLNALNFLDRYKEENREISDLLNWIKTKKWDLLFDDEKEWLKKKLFI